MLYGLGRPGAAAAPGSRTLARINRLERLVAGLACRRTVKLDGGDRKSGRSECRRGCGEVLSGCPDARGAAAAGAGEGAGRGSCGAWPSGRKRFELELSL